MKKFLTWLIVAVLVVGCSAALSGCSNDNKEALSDAYDLAEEKYTQYYLEEHDDDSSKVAAKQFDEIFELASDGSYLSINLVHQSSSYDNAQMAYDIQFQSRLKIVVKCIEDINKELDMPDSLLKSIETTTAKDGKQSKDYNGISVSWTYSDSKGLDLTYEVKE